MASTGTGYMGSRATFCIWAFLLSTTLIAAGCAALDAPYAPGSVNDVGYGGRFRQPASG
jgi:hypothetical protein